MEGNSFYLKLDVIEGHVLRAKIDESIVWHNRFGHYNFKSLKMLHDSLMVEGMPEIHVSDKICEGYELGKQHRKSFPHSVTSRATLKLELVHSDICGPMKTPSLNNNVYFILFIDDYSMMIWVQFLKTKSKHSLCSRISNAWLKHKVVTKSRY